MQSAVRNEICVHVLERILAGELGIDDRLPTEFELASQFSTSRMNAHLAVKLLERQGVVRRNKRQGTFVHRRPDPALFRQWAGAHAMKVHLFAPPHHEQMPMHWNEITLRDLETTLAENGYTLVHHTVDGLCPQSEWKTLLMELAEEGVAALVLLLDSFPAGFIRESADILFEYHSNSYILGRGALPVENLPFHTLRYDPFGEGVLAAEYLYRLGYRDIAFWYAEELRAEHWLQERKRGLGLGLKRASAGTLTAAEWVFPAECLAAEVCRKVREQICHFALVSANDMATAELVDHARQAGLSAPRDFSLLGFDDDPRYRGYNLTTVAPPLDRVGKLLGRLICENAFPKGDGNLVSIRMASKVVERGTCGPPRFSAKPRSSRPRLAVAGRSRRDAHRTIRSTPQVRGLTTEDPRKKRTAATR